MKPIKLEIEGLNSFENNQVLDFSKLGSGVFGIFGKTGSGKSTILDAIILALYGDLSRTKQNIDFINKKKKKTVVSLEFEIFYDGEVRNYFIKRTFQIKKNAKDVDSNAELYEIIDGIYKIIAENVNKVNEKIAEIFKLGKNEFVKCIALPQGEFSAFLQAKPAERTEILSNIFDLTKYGDLLYNNVKEKLNEYDKQIAVLGSNLTRVDYATDEKLSEVKKSFDNNSENYKIISEDLKQKNNEYQEKLKLLENKVKLEKLNEQYYELTGKKSEMDLLEKEIDKNVCASKIQSDYQKLGKDKKDKIELESKISSMNENRLKSQSEKTDAENDFEVFKKDYDEKIISLSNRLEKINELLNYEKDEKKFKEEEKFIKNEIKVETDKLENQNKELDEVKAKISQIEQEIYEIDVFIDENRPDVELSYLLETTKNIESELILIEDFTKNIESLFDKTKSDLVIANEEYNSFISQEQHINEKTKYIQQSIEKAFEFDDENDKTNFDKVRSCDKQLDLMKNIKIKASFIDNEIERLKKDKNNRNSIINVIDSQLIEEQNKLTAIEKSIEEKEKYISLKRDEREETLGGNFFSLVSNQLKIGDNCPVCNGKVVSKSYGEVVDIKTITNEIASEEQYCKNLKSDRDKVFANMVTLKARIEFEKAQIQIDNDEIELLETKKLVIYREVITSSDNTIAKFNKYYDALSSTVESLEKLIDLQDSLREEHLNIVVSKANAGTKISLYNSYLEDLNEVLYSLQKKKAEREFAVINFNEKYINLKDYKKQIAEGKNIEIVIEEKKERKFNLKDEQTKLIVSQANIENNISSINAKVSILTEKLSLKQEQYKYIQDKINDFGISENETVSSEQIKTLNELNELKNEYNIKEMKLESCRDLLARTTRDYDINLSILNSKKESINELETKISNMMIEYQFKSNDELEKYFELPAVLKEKQNKLSEFKTNYKLVTTQKAELETYSYNNISQENVDLIKEEVEDLSEKSKILSEEIGKNKANFEQISADNKQRNELTTELAEAKHKFDLAKELSVVLKGKALAEYVAEEYLQEIIYSANQKLSLLLDGKYLLMYKNKEFWVQDNFNDGVIRSASTLSGGETFLVSLSLALAISDSISMLSSRNIEFFFLDEGFGTLDPELCETVVSALHKLENNNLKIGLISHIVELEEAIKNKVYVAKTNSGSKISIEHSL